MKRKQNPQKLVYKNFFKHEKILFIQNCCRIFIKNLLKNAKKTYKLNNCNLNWFVQLPLGFTTWKVSKYRVIYDPYFPAFGLNTEIYRVITLEITPYLDTFHAELGVQVEKYFGTQWLVNHIQRLGLSISYDNVTILTICSWKENNRI